MSKEYTRSLTVLGLAPTAGSILLDHHFSNILHWGQTGGAGDAIYELDPTISERHSQSLFLKTRTTDAAEDDLIGTRNRIHLRNSLFLGFACIVYSPAFTAIKYIEFRFFFNNGDDRKIAAVRFYPNTPIWKYENPYDTLNDIPGSDITLLNSTFHRIALEASFTLDSYLSLQVDHRLFDLSSFPITPTANPADISLTFDLEICTVGAAPCQLHLSEVLIYEL